VLGRDLAQTNWSEVCPTNLGQYRPKTRVGPKFYSLFFSISFFSFPLLLFIFFHSFFFFVLIIPLFFSPSSPRGEGVFIRGRGARATLPLSSDGDRVGWLGRPLCNHPRVACRACLPCPFHHCGRSWGGVGYVRVFGQEGGETAKKNFLPLPLRVKGRRRCTMQFKTSFFFLYMNSEWNNVILYKMRRFI